MSTTTSRGRGRAWQVLCEMARRVYPPVCHLCGQWIDVSLPGTHPMSWTLDHLDPVAVAGPRVPHISRTLPAHRRCNSSRGAAVLPAAGGTALSVRPSGAC